MISSAILEKEGSIRINTLGIEPQSRSSSLYIDPIDEKDFFNLRQADDGYVYFGMQAQPQKKLNDFILVPRDESDSEKLPGRHFQVYFNTDTTTYNIKDLGIGYGVFRNLTQPILLQDSFLMNMGESYIVINLDDDTQDERSPEEESKNLDEFIDSVRKSKKKEESSTVNLRLKVFGGPSSGETFQFERSVG